MLAAATDRVAHLLVAERGRIFQLHWTQGILHPRVTQTDGADPLMIELPITKGIAGSGARTGQPLFYPESDRRTGYRTHIILCLPILNREGEPFGGGAVAQYARRALPGEGCRPLGGIFLPAGHDPCRLSPAGAFGASIGLCTKCTS